MNSKIEEKPILLHGTRILRPLEATELINAIPKRKYEIQFKALLFTGARYIEIQRFFKHAEWFDGKFIHLPAMAIKKAKRKQRERWIRLNPLGREVIKSFLSLDENLPTKQAYNQNLKRWALQAGFNSAGLSAKTTRKTWESWLVFYYPDKLANIVLSQGHTALTSIQHYLNMPFTNEDKEEMKEFVEGWI